MTHHIPDSTIIAAFWWSDSRADIACKLHTTADHVKRVWAKAKEKYHLPDIERPAEGFDPRVTALVQTLSIPPYDRGSPVTNSPSNEAGVVQ